MSMDSFNLKQLTIPQVVELIQLAQTELHEKQKAEKENVRKQMEELAKKAGMTIDEVLGTGKGRKRSGTRAKAEPKYANPANSSETWSGRGRKPKWVEEAISKGRKIGELLIKKAS